MKALRRARAWALVIGLAAGVASAAADLEIVSQMSFEANGKKYIEPCVRNNSQESRQAHFKIGSAGVRWTFRPMTIAPGQTSCFALDAPPIAPGIANEVHVE
jgi:hypothetical protein